MKEDEAIEVFFSRFTNIVDNIKILGDTTEDKKIVQGTKKSSSKI